MEIRNRYLVCKEDFVELSRSYSPYTRSFSEQDMLDLYYERDYSSPNTVGIFDTLEEARQRFEDLKKSCSTYELFGCGGIHYITADIITLEIEHNNGTKDEDSDDGLFWDGESTHDIYIAPFIKKQYRYVVGYAESREITGSRTSFGRLSEDEVYELYVKDYTEDLPVVGVYDSYDEAQAEFDKLAKGCHAAVFPGWVSKYLLFADIVDLHIEFYDTDREEWEFYDNMDFYIPPYIPDNGENDEDDDE